MLESQFKKKERERFEKLGWKFITLEPGAGLPMGMPDTLVLSPTGYHCFVEWKKSKNAKKQPLQQYWHDKLNLMGHDAYFVSPEVVDDWQKTVIERSENYGKTVR